MNLTEAKQKLEKAEPMLTPHTIILFSKFDTPHGALHLLITDRFRRKCCKGRVWKSPAMLTALKNAAYGFDGKASRSRGGADGIFCVDRNYRPANSMMKKLYPQFLDKPDPLVSTLSHFLDSPYEQWIAVRLVSHHMRLLGIIDIIDDTTRLVLVDYDHNKRG